MSTLIRLNELIIQPARQIDRWEVHTTRDPLETETVRLGTFTTDEVKSALRHGVQVFTTQHRAVRESDL